MNTKLLKNIRIILIGTTHPGNIGAAARAMKSMGLTELTLVSPEAFPHPAANARATSALDVLQNAKVVETLHEAIEDCGTAIATRAQLPSLRWPEIPVREIGEQTLKLAQDNPVAIVFGRERTGMHIDEINQCQYLVQIPTNPDCYSLNLAAAVQVIAYEIMMASIDHKPQQTQEAATPSIDDMHRFHEHLFETLVEVEFLNREQPRRLRQRLIRLFNKAQLDENELNILRGILTAVNRSTVRK